MDEVWIDIEELHPYKISNNWNIKNGETSAIILSRKTKTEKAKRTYSFYPKKRFLILNRDGIQYKLSIEELMKKYHTQ